MGQAEQQAQTYPFDFESLKPGDFVGPDRLEALLGMPAGFDHRGTWCANGTYALKCQELVERIKRERSDLPCWFVDSGIMIGDAIGTFRKVRRRIGSAKRKLKWTAKMAMLIPVNELPPNMQREAENVMQIAAAQAVVVGGITTKRLAKGNATEELPNAGAHLRLIGKKPTGT